MRLRLSIKLLVVVYFFMFTGMAVSASKKPMTVAELALYRGKDRQQILEAGAKREGQLIFYTSGTQSNLIAKAFHKKSFSRRIRAYIRLFHGLDIDERSETYTDGYKIILVSPDNPHTRILLSGDDNSHEGEGRVQCHNSLCEVRQAGPEGRYHNSGYERHHRRKDSRYC